MSSCLEAPPTLRDVMEMEQTIVVCVVRVLSYIRKDNVSYTDLSSTGDAVIRCLYVTLGSMMRVLVFTD